jgi:hypothetical protein
VNKNQIVSVGFNRNKTHPMMGTIKHLHAEADCIRHARIKARERDIPIEVIGASMYVFRTTRNGNVGCSKPCKVCEKILRGHFVKEVYYIDDDKCINRMEL